MNGPGPRALMAERVPFVVEPLYKIRPDLTRLPPDERHFVLDESWPRYLREKLRLLRDDPGRCRLLAGDEKRLQASLRELAAVIAAEHPRQLRLESDCLILPRLGLRLDRLDGSSEPSHIGEHDDVAGPATDLRSHLAALAPLQRLVDALALSVQEDMVLMAGPAGREQAELLHVCFPSHWDPGAMSGADFGRFHAPVPHNEKLMSGARNLMAAMLAKGPFVRHVWSITGSASLDQNPARRAGREDETKGAGIQPPGDPAGRPDHGNLLDRLWFRVERQTTRALQRHALFTIRVFVTPLRAVLSPERAALITAAIRSMDEDLLRYKGLDGVADQLLAALDEAATTGPGRRRS